MTTVRTVAAHEVVRATFPRPVTEKDEIGMAVGKAIDGALSQYSHEFAQGRRPSRTAMNRVATDILDEELRDADLDLAADERERHCAAIGSVLQAFRQSEVMGLPRPKSRLILINERVGVYAQPDYWDGRGRFYEMKSYHADPIPPDVRLQVDLFQCAFPKFRAYLAWFDRHATPVSTTIQEISPLSSSRVESVPPDRVRHRPGEGDREGAGVHRQPARSVPHLRGIGRRRTDPEPGEDARAGIRTQV